VNGADSSGFHNPLRISLRLANTRAPASVVLSVARAGVPLRVTPVSREPRKSCPAGGFKMPPATGLPLTTNPTEIHHSGIPSTNSRVPSMGSTIQTRCLFNRSGLSAVSSESQPSPGPSSISLRTLSRAKSAAVTGSPPTFFSAAMRPGVNAETTFAASARASWIRIKSFSRLSTRSRFPSVSGKRGLRGRLLRGFHCGSGPVMFRCLSARHPAR